MENQNLGLLRAAAPPATTPKTLLKIMKIDYRSFMNESEPAIVHAARLLATRLERLSADSYWAHKASGLRGSLLRSLEDWERNAAANPTWINS